MYGRQRENVRDSVRACVIVYVKCALCERGKKEEGEKERR